MSREGFEPFDRTKREHVKAECLICNRKRVVRGAVATAYGLTFVYCMSCIDKLHKAAYYRGAKRDSK